MGKYQKNIEAARRITVMQYLETYHPGELVRKTDREYLLKDIYKHVLGFLLEMVREDDPYGDHSDLENMFFKELGIFQN